MYKNQIIPSVNFHLWEPCNMKCKFCFATFHDVRQRVLPKGHLPKGAALRIVKSLADFGFKKITFAGGEPTLCLWLTELIQCAKSEGMTTMVVTNGSMLTDDFLKRNRKVLDWIAISVDSINSATNLATGRAMSGGRTLSHKDYLSTAEKVKQHGYRLKINTVVNSINYCEDLNLFIKQAQPDRWKVLQALPIEGQNDNSTTHFAISDQKYAAFVERHKENPFFVPEKTSDIINSYVMVDPAGRFFSNATGKHRYSLPILEVGVEHAYAEMNYDLRKFIDRGGVYEWERKKSNNRKPIAYSRVGEMRKIARLFDHLFEDKANSAMRNITLSGLAGSGKSTIAKHLSNECEYEFVSIGNYARQYALEKKGMTINEFQDYCRVHPEEDQAIDQQFKDYCNEKYGLVIDYRLGFHFVKGALNVFLKVSDEVAAERIGKSNRNAEDLSSQAISERNSQMRERFKNTYGLDFTDESNYDLVIDTSDISVDEIVNQIICVLG